MSLRPTITALRDTGQYVVWTPNPGPQTAAVTCPIADILFGGARGGGKSDCLLGRWLYHQARYGKAARGILIRRTTDELDELKDRAEQLFKPLGAKWRANRRAWYFPNGAIVKFRFLARDADASKYQGHSYTFVGIDEVGNFASADPINKMRSTLRTKHPGVVCELFMTANPGGPGHAWLKADYIDPAPGFTPFPEPLTGELRIFIPSRLTDNPYLATDATYRNRIRQSGPSWLVAAWLNGDWNATPDGGVWKSKWFRYYQQRPIGETLLIVQSWDTASKPKQINDPSVCTTWAVTKNRAYLLHQYRERMDYPTLKAKARALYEQWKPDEVLIEDKGSGIALIQELKKETMIPVIPVMPLTDKVSRAVGVAAMFEAGMVWFPEGADWLIDFEIELTTFPLAANDDRVDSVSQALARIRQRGTATEPVTSGNKRTSLSHNADGFTGQAGTGRSVDQDFGFGTIHSGRDLDGF